MAPVALRWGDKLVPHLSSESWQPALLMTNSTRATAVGDSRPHIEVSELPRPSVELRYHRRRSSAKPSSERATIAPARFRVSVEASGARG